MTTITQCKFCTVPVEHGNVCWFCSTYIPPEPADTATKALADSYTAATSGADRLGKLIPALPGDLPLWTVVDLTTAAAHLRVAARLIDRAAVRITTEEVAR